ncbi:UNVERIFIED_CONTAM: hypothetical protein K2H54_044417 [Gekko kuhli]
MPLSYGPILQSAAKCREGSLLLKKWSSLVAEQHVFKRPMLRASLMGLDLDLLAAQKHHEKERQASGGGKRYKDLANGKDSPVAAQEQRPDGDEGKGDGHSTMEP